MDHSVGEIKRVVAFLLAEESPSYSVVLAVQQLTSILISRHETSAIVRSHGSALLAKMRHFLQQEPSINEPSRNDFYYSMIWMYDPAKGENDANLHALLSHTGFFVSELVRAMHASSHHYAANILNGLANLVAYVGRRVVEPYFQAHGVLAVVAKLLDSHADSVNAVSAAILFGNYFSASECIEGACDSAESVALGFTARLLTMVPVLADVLRAAVQDLQYGGRTWSPKGACEALSNLAKYPQFHEALLHAEVPSVLLGVLFRDWSTRANFGTLGTRYYADALGFAAHALWSLRFAVDLDVDVNGFGAHMNALAQLEAMRPTARECLLALRDTVLSRQLVCDTCSSTTTPMAVDQDSGLPSPGYQATSPTLPDAWHHPCIVVCERAIASAALEVAARMCLDEPAHLLVCHALTPSELAKAVRLASSIVVVPSPGLAADPTARATLQLAVCLARPTFAAPAPDPAAAPLVPPRGRMTNTEPQNSHHACLPPSATGEALFTTLAC
eukprot:m.221581 g.221581  ORF g.221581 m.221581 type:complete len:503 (-) comp15842_c0_seq1:293-1801(-)